MTGRLTIQVPRARTACYLVSAGLAVPQAKKLALEGVEEYASGARRRQVHELLERKAVVFGVMRARDRAKLTPALRDLMGRADAKWVSIRVEAPTGREMSHERVARTLAAELAYRLRSPVADMLVPKLLSVERVFASLDPKEDGAFRLSDWVAVAYEAAVPDKGPDYAPNSLDLETAGLSRYGIPELRVTGVPTPLARRWCAILTGVAFRVREEFFTLWPTGTVPAEVVIPDEIGVTADDVAAAYCLPGGFRSREMGWRGTEFGAPETCFALELTGEVLVLRPPCAWEGADREFFTSACFGNLQPSLTLADPFVGEFQEVYRGPEDWQCNLRCLVSSGSDFASCGAFREYDRQRLVREQGVLNFSL
jgi:hypothetical protein